MTTTASFSLARRLRAGETVYAAWCTLASPIVAETIAREGFAAVVLDIQHGLWDTASIVAGIGALHHAGSTPVVRVPLNDFAFVSRALDFGAEAIIAPMINTAADARQFAAVAKFPPLGERSWGPQRAMTLQELALQGKTATVDYLREANDGTLTLAMIETPAALANVEAIAGTPGIDALFIGPYDLSTALSGGKAQDVQAPRSRTRHRPDRRGGEKGRQNSRHLLPRRRARARHGQARLPLHHHRQRSWHLARRRGGAGEGAKGLTRNALSSPRRRGPITPVSQHIERRGYWVPALANARPGRQRRAHRAPSPHPALPPPPSPRPPGSRARSATPASRRAMRAAASFSAAGTRSITHLSGNDTKSAMCGPIGTCRLKPRPAKRRSFTSACQSARSASVGLRRSSRGKPRSGVRSDGARPAPCSASRSRSFCAPAPSSTPPRAGPFAPLRDRRDHAVQGADVLLGRRHALENIAQVHAHGAALFLGAEKFDLVELALEIGEQCVELLLGRRRRFLRASERQFAAAACLNHS